MLDRLFANTLYPTGLEFSRVEGYPNSDAGILLIPGRYWAGREAEISVAISRYSWCLMIVTSDEESLFDTGKIDHPAVRFWIQTPRVGRDYGTARFIPLGFPPYFDHLEPATRNLDVFLAGQCTHQRRKEAFAALEPGERRRIEPTTGFLQGMDPAEYVRCMSAAKVAPAPSGAVSPDSFRVWEALEAHAIPVADDVSPTYDSRGYWRMLLGDPPFPILTDYSNLPGWIDDLLADWPRNANRVTGWWLTRKRLMRDWLRADLAALGADVPDLPRVTVLVTCSPIPSHPSTHILEETIASVRERLPRAEIFLVFDGVRPEQEARRADYEEFIRRALWLADHEWGNVLPFIHDEHLHQGECARRAVEAMTTPLLLFMEHDTPLTGEISFADIAATIEAGDANVVRFAHEAAIHPEHRYLMLDTDPQDVRGVPMMRTAQWSNRPHLASVAWYRVLLEHHFPPGLKDFIEDRCYGPLVNAVDRDGVMGWLGWRTWIYTPEGNIQRSFHTNGRAGENKFD
ncbi:hypothetical protein [Nocardia aurea]|uniref:hypothetical protein n=1 Tax=Nocardia aurea TaxID=2144174 RepID=UPI0033A22E2C